MKSIFIILLFFPHFVNGQFEFDPDSISPLETQLGIPDPDSIKFEFRLWNNSQSFSLFTQLSLNQKNEWNYHTGFINHDGDIYYLKSNPDIDLSELWKILDSLGVRSLPSQEIATASLEINGYPYKLPFEEFEKMTQSTEGSLIIVELFNQSNYRTYYYYDPIRISKGIKNSKQSWESKEHFAMAKIVQTVNNTLDIHQAYKIYFEKEVNNL